MYPIQCAGGFSIPLKAGKFRIMGIKATISDPTAVARIMLVDDPDISKNQSSQGYLISSASNQRRILADIKSVASTVGCLEADFPSPIKTRHGTSAYFTNVLPGSVCVYEE